jgi:hypothetical protein
MRYVIILILAMLCQIITPGQAQQTLMEKKVSLHFQQVRLATVLAVLKTRYGVQFSYANNLIPLDKKINVDVTEKPLNQALEELFRETGVEFTQVGSQIVLRKGIEKPKKAVSPSKPKTQPKTSKTKVSLPKTEAPNDAEDQTAVASLLPIPSLTEVKENGEQPDSKELKQEFKAEKRNLAKNYLAQMDAALETGDTSVLGKIKKEFRELGKGLDSEFDRISEKIQKRKWNPFGQNNTGDSTKNANSGSPVQVSFIPPMSTNGADNKNKVNELSFNILAGYSGGLNGFEAGGIANVENGNVKGVQVSGFANIVHGNLEGVQAAGFVNAQKGAFEAVQLAGFMNFAGSDSSNGFQAAGFGNLHQGDLFGGQAAGFINVNNGYLIGPQVSGFLNVAKGPVSGAQVAGFMNQNHGNISGVQAAGFLNISRNVLGSQVAGFMNVSKKEVRGAQISGFMNVAKNVKGPQIGIINFADSVNGPQIGLLSFSRKGYRRLEVFGAERIQANAAFRMGTRSFHNIFLFGINPMENNSRWSYGYGFGTEFDLGKKTQMNLDLVCNQIIENERLSTQNLNLLNQLKLHFGWHPGKRTTFFAGPTLNVAVSRVKDKETGVIGTDIIPDWAFFKETNGPTRLAIWAGFNAGLRF